MTLKFENPDDDIEYAGITRIELGQELIALTDNKDFHQYLLFSDPDMSLLTEVTVSREIR